MCFAYSFISSLLSFPCCSIACLLACTRRLFYPTTHTHKHMCTRVAFFVFFLIILLLSLHSSHECLSLSLSII